MELCVVIGEYVVMESQGSVLVVGQPAVASRLEPALDSGTVVRRETTAAALEYLEANTEPTDCVVTDHDPPERDCFGILTEAAIPVVVAVTSGSSELATTVHRQGAAAYIDRSTLDDPIDALASEIHAVSGGRAGEQAGGAGDAASAQLATNRDHVEEFVSIISHELRTPVQKANSGLDLVAADCDSGYIDDVRDPLERMEELLDELISIVKYGDSVEETTAIDLEPIVTDTWPNAPNSSLEIESSLPTIAAEESRLRQVFENLFRNALEHGSGETQIRVGVIEYDDAAASETTGIYVADDGPGVPPEKREQVFEYGYTGADDGTGLGLAIVDRIVDGFGWEITITESRDGGARFELRDIPVA
ncbi:MAG: ATP-binding protein [Halonotius sp.]